MLHARQFNIGIAFKTISTTTQVLFIGEPNQRLSVGAGNVLKDLDDSIKVPCFVF
jgi:ATP-dependent exoDNAse (exonuclease V) alpha subunit